MDIQKHYLNGAIPLFDAIALWMHSNEPCPEWLKREYENSLNAYNSGGDFMQMMGFDLTKGMSTPEKRKQRDKDIQLATNLKHILNDLVEFGLYKVAPANHKAENKMRKPTLDQVQKYLDVYKARLSPKEKEKLEYMTAYEVAGLIFRISESKVRELERLNNSFNLMI